jgi:hypothetical protein
MIFEQICTLEPGVRNLLRQAQAIKDDANKPSYCAANTWYDWDEAGWSFHTRLSRLLGPAAWRPSLKHPELQNIACSVIYRRCHRAEHAQATAPRQHQRHPHRRESDDASFSRDFQRNFTATSPGCQHARCVAKCSTPEKSNPPKRNN